MGLAPNSILCLMVLGLYVPFQIADSFYFEPADTDEIEQHPKEFLAPFTVMEEPIQFDDGSAQDEELTKPQDSDIAELFRPNMNKSQEPDLGCDDVREERYRCCRVFDHMVEAWWCSERRPFCCQQGTSCAVCCTVDEFRRLEGGRRLGDCRQRSAGVHRPPTAPPVDDENWFWNGMKAAWLTMVGVVLASLCCTCLAHKCITYLVTIVNEEDSDLEEEYLAYHFDSVALVGGEDRPSDRQAASRGLLPPKYSDINFIPAQPEVPVIAAVPSEPPPQYTSDTETEPAPPSAPPGPNEV